MTTDSSAHTSARRIARNVGLRLAGDLVGKVASLLFFVAIARKLGTTDFGDFTFALALTGTLILASGLGTDTLTAREVSRSQERLDDFLANVVTLKVATSAVALALAVVIAHVGGYSTGTQVAVLLLGLGVTIENLGRTWYAAFQAFERMEFISISLAVQRITTAAGAIAVLELGGGLKEVALVYLVCAVLGFGILVWALPAFVAAPRWRVERSRLVPLALAGIPVGLAGLLFTFLLRADTVLLSFLTHGDNAQVGIYGAAFRLIEATMFLSWVLGAAMLPWLSRRSAEGDALLAGGYELGLKAISAALIPVALACSLLAEPIIVLLYGDGYDEAVTPLRILGPLIVLYAINYLTATALTAHDRPGLFTRQFGVVTVVNLALNIVLIPRYGPTGAAISAVASGAVLAVLSLRQAHRALGALRPDRAFAGPLAGTAAMAAVTVAVGSSLVPSLVLGSLAYLTGLAAFERLVFPQQFGLIVALARRPPPALLEPPTIDTKTLLP